MDSSTEEKLQNMGEIMAATVHQTIFCSGIDSAAKAKARPDMKKVQREFQKFGVDGAAPGCTSIQHNRCLGSLISSSVLFTSTSTDWTIVN